jgi:hypothetical protein
MSLNFAARHAVGAILPICVFFRHWNIIPEASACGLSLAFASIQVTATRTEGGTHGGRRGVARSHTTDECACHGAGDLRILLHRSAKLTEMFARRQPKGSAAKDHR